MKKQEEKQKTNHRSRAYSFMKKYVTEYLEKNFHEFSANHSAYRIEENIFAELKANKNDCLEWLLGEMLSGGEFAKMGIVLECDWGKDELNNIHSTIYKIGDKLIRDSFTEGNYLVCHKFEFVKQIKKKIVTYEIVYEVEK